MHEHCSSVNTFHRQEFTLGFKTLVPMGSIPLEEASARLTST